jgi:Spy/CpxP family protein refolding chaperone
MTRRLAFAPGAMLCVMLFLAATVFAADLPPGKWWRRPEIVTQLALTEDQQNKLETIFRTSANDLIDLKGEVEKQNIALRGELDQPQLDRKNIRAAAARLSEARSKLFERELMLLVDMRSVLTESQWNRMRTALERRDERQPMQAPMRRQPRR